MSATAKLDRPLATISRFRCDRQAEQNAACAVLRPKVLCIDFGAPPDSCARLVTRTDRQRKLQLGVCRFPTERRICAKVDDKRNTGAPEPAVSRQQKPQTVRSRIWTCKRNPEFLRPGVARIYSNRFLRLSRKTVCSKTATPSVLFVSQRKKNAGALVDGVPQRHLRVFDKSNRFGGLRSKLGCTPLRGAATIGDPTTSVATAATHLGVSP